MIQFPDDDVLVIQNSPTPKVRPLVSVTNPPTGEIVFLTDRLAEEGGFDVNNSMEEDATGHARVSFERSAGTGGSLSPLNAFSAEVFSDGRPFFDPGVQLQIYTEVRSVGHVPNGPAGDDPIGGSEVKIFQGRIDRVPIVTGEDMMEVQCRDQGAYLLNTQIRTEEQRGGALMEDVIQGLINDYMPIPIAFQCPVASDFFIEPYPQQPGSVLDACRIIAQQRGWDCRWFTSAGAIVLYEPRRDANGPDRYLDPTRYTKITALELSDDDLRNWWHVYWTDADGAIHGPVEAKDDASILRYGPKFSRIYVDRARNIRTEANAIAFAEAALADNVLPFTSHAVKVACYPEVEVADLHSYTTADGSYSGSLFGSVVQYGHEYRKGHLDTTINVRPRALAAYRDYRLSVPPKVLVSTSAPAPDFYAPEGTVVMVTDSLLFPA